MRRTKVASRDSSLSPVTYLPTAAWPEADEAELVRGLQQGDSRSAREAWYRYGPTVRRVLLRALGPIAELEDLSQEVFITFFDRVATLRDPRTVTAFLMSITAFRIRHHLRWRWVRRWVVPAGSAPPVDLRTIQADDDAREALQRFFAALDHLSPIDRTAFTLRFVEQLEMQQVADALGWSAATTKRRLAKIWKRLSALLRNDAALAPFLAKREGSS
ncbi:MAG TPA: sigma-70 family RNA polymerase sigma factor [Polyangia bacterium]|nr:sigma-70 family RNA polymerase sigma factor [Polyangia bacterium]